MTDKKMIKVKKNAKVPETNISAEGSLKVDELSLAKLLRYDAEGRAVRGEIQRLQLSLLAYRKQIDPNGILTKMQNDINANEQRMKEFEAEHNALKDALGEKLKLDFRKVSFDTETGVIWEIPNPEEDKKHVK